MRGKGAKRLLSIAIQLSLVEDGGIILIDEIEQGLEPDRVVNIIRLLKGSPKGQVFITTHSSEALCEVEYNNVYILQKGKPRMGLCDKGMATLLRSAPYTFFAKRVVCCEGKTEYGIIRSIGEHLRNVNQHSLGSLGICPADCGGGTKHLDWAPKFKSLGYDVCVFSDNDDLPNKYQDKVDILEQNEIPLFRWEEGKCTEQQMMKDLPWSYIVVLIKYLIENNNAQELNADGLVLNDETLFDSFSAEQQTQIKDFIASNSKKNNKKGEKTRKWFKDISGGEMLGTVWANSISALDPKSSLNSVFEKLLTWILKDVKVD